ncbi:MAG: acylphosphatase [Methanomicrobium sp.]|nr:acylphosphatase [Methanomicrobium sp.]
MGDGNIMSRAGDTTSHRTITVEAYVSGKVQGVGFRACVRNIAAGLSLTGIVQNLDDGRVFFAATGDSASIDKLISSLHECPRAIVKNIDSKEVPLRSFEGFNIVRIP